MRTSRGDGSSCFDVVGVLLGALSCRDPAVERLVAPVGCRELVEVSGGQLVRHDVCSELVRAEDVIPVGVGEDDVGRLGHASGGERVEESRVCAAEEPASSQIVARSPSTAQSDGRSGGIGGSQYTCSLIFSMWSA